MFTVSAYLVFCNRVVNVLYASTMIGINNEDFQAKAPIWKYLVISISNVLATTCQYECLKYVSFPVQMLGKSFKMMPVMLWGVALAVTFGVTVFCMTGPTSAPSDKANSFYGFALLVMFLAFDGLTSTFQEKLFKEHNTSKFNQMFYVNGCSAVTSLITVLAMGKMSYCIAFMADPEFLRDVTFLSIAA